MKVRVSLLVLFACQIACNSSLPPLAAQEEEVLKKRPVRARPALPMPAMALAPAMARNPLRLSNLVLAKFDSSKDPPQIIMLVEQFRKEEREVQVTVMRQEQRTRTITVEQDGKEVEREQTYTVAVPVTEKRNVRVNVPAGKKPVKVAFDKLKAYRLDGTPATVDDLKETLSTLKPVFLTGGINLQPPTVSDTVRQALQPDLLFIFTDAVGNAPPLPAPQVFGR